MAVILVIGPHPDDQELAMGGTIALLASQGHKVILADMTDGEPTPHGSREVRAVEAAAAASALSSPGNPVARVQLGLTNRRVVHDLESRHRLAGLIRAVGAQVLFIPYFEDAHPDHLAVTRIAEDARFDAKLSGQPMPGDQGRPPIHPGRVIYYFATHLKLVPRPSFVVDISAQVTKKRAAIAAYHTQVGPHTGNATLPSRIEDQDRYFGSRIGTQAGEPFFVREPIGLMGMQGVIGF